MNLLNIAHWLRLVACGLRLIAISSGKQLQNNLQTYLLAPVRVNHKWKELQLPLIAQHSERIARVRLHIHLYLPYPQ